MKNPEKPLFNDGKRIKIWGHCHLIRKERTVNSIGDNDIPDQSYTFFYRCDCGRTWSQSAHTRMWHCGALDCPHLPRRKKQAFLPRQVGRPRKYDPLFGEDDESHSTSLYRKRITFGLPVDERDEFEGMCSALHTSMNHELQELVRGWIASNLDAANKAVKRVNNYTGKESTAGKEILTPEQAEEKREKEELHARRFAVYSKPKSLEEFFAVGQDRWRPKKKDGSEW